MRVMDWDRMWDIFHEALELPVPERDHFVARACGEDAAMRREVESLLLSHQDGSPFLAPTGMMVEKVLGEEGIEELGPGESVGPYRIVRLIGEGGMGAVFEAQQIEPVRRRVALKLIRLGMDTAEVVARFEAERQALAMMDHPNIARVFDAGATGRGRPFFVMEYVEGEPITSYCDQARLDTKARLQLFVRVCRGVQHAHQKGIIHRDLKPSNVLVTTVDGKAVPKIIDFGIAKATSQRLTEKTFFTREGVLVGTPEYMSPEQADLPGLDVDTRTDVYSLGIVLYELLVGALPFDPRRLQEAGFEEIRRRIREDVPSRPSTRLTTLGEHSVEAAHHRRTDMASLSRLLRGDLDWITMRALEKESDRRYGSPSDLAADIERHLANEPVLAGPPSARYRVGKFIRRHRSAATFAAVALLAMIVSAAGLGVGILRARQAERQARQEAEVATRVSDFLVGLFQVSQPSEEVANSVTAREILDRGAQHIREELAGQPEVQSRLMWTMGSVYSQIGLYETAEELFREALDIRRPLVGQEHDDVGRLGDLIGSTLHTQGRDEEALPLLEEALAVREAALGRDHPDLAVTLRNLGLVYSSLLRLDEAAAMHERAVAIAETAHGPEHPDVGRELRLLGIVRWEQKDYETAGRLYERCLQIFEASLGPEHPDVAYTVNSLAILYWNLEDYQAALPMFERTLQSIERTHGPDHPYTASAMNNLGRLLLDMGRLEDAGPHLERSLAVREVALGPDHPEVATSLVNLGRLALAERELEKARVRLERCIEIREAKLGPDHPHLATALETYAKVLRELGDDSSAAVVEERVRVIRARAES